MANRTNAGVEALQRLKATDPPSWLAPNPTLSQAARAASQYFFSSLRPFSQKLPLDQLLIDGFDTEQIWQQIDLQSQPLIATLRRRVKRLEKNPEELSHLNMALEGKKKVEAEKNEEWNEESDGFDEEFDEFDDEEEEEGQEEERGGKGRGKLEAESVEEEVEEEDEEEEGESGESESEDDHGAVIEDEFLKVKDLAKYLQKEEENYENGELDKEEDGQSEESDEVKLLFFACFGFNFLCL